MYFNLLGLLALPHTILPNHWFIHSLNKYFLKTSMCQALSKGTAKAKLIVCQNIFSQISFHRFLPYSMAPGAVMLQQKDMSQEHPCWFLYSGSSMKICAERPKKKWLFLLLTIVFAGLDLGDRDCKIWSPFSKLLLRSAPLTGSTEGMLAYILPWVQTDLG